jgi:RES domain-containing protein
VVYLGSSAPLALLDVQVHLEWGAVLSAYCLFEVSSDESLLTRVEVDELPRRWASGAPPVETQLMGDEWIREGRSGLVVVPSAIVPQHAYYLLNPGHPDFAKVTIGQAVPSPIDERLVRK